MAVLMSTYIERTKYSSFPTKSHVPNKMCHEKVSDFHKNGFHKSNKICEKLVHMPRCVGE